MQAAEELSVTPSAVSQQIRTLEEQIGTTLVARNGRNIRLTEAGERYFDLISEKVEGVIRATEMMRGTRQVANMVIRTTPTIATKWLLPRLGRFLKVMPDTNIRIDGSNEPVDFNRDKVDRSNHSSIVVRQALANTIGPTSWRNASRNRQHIHLSSARSTPALPPPIP